MSFQNLVTSLQNHSISFPEDTVASHAITSWIEQYKEFAFVKENLLWHITGSLFIVNPSHTKILLMFHKKLQMWIQFWGYADGEADIRNVAIREFHEESGVWVEPLLLWEIFHVDVHDIPEHKDKPKHIHFDIRYLWIIPDDSPISHQETEVDDIRWFNLDEVGNYNDEPTMKTCIERIKNLSH